MHSAAVQGCLNEKERNEWEGEREHERDRKWEKSKYFSILPEQAPKSASTNSILR